MEKFLGLIIFFIILNFIFFILNDYISNKINLFDYPDNKRKLHKEKQL